MLQSVLDKLLDEEYLRKVEDTEAKVDKYNQHKFVTCQQIYSTISDSLLIKVKYLPVKANWLDQHTLQQNRNNICIAFGRTTVSTGGTEAESYVRVPALCSEGLRNTVRGSQK